MMFFILCFLTFYNYKYIYRQFLSFILHKKKCIGDLFFPIEACANLRIQLIIDRTRMHCMSKKACPLYIAGIPLHGNTVNLNIRIF